MRWSIDNMLVPHGHSPARLGLLAMLGFALAALTLEPAVDRDAGIPAIAALREAQGRVASVTRHRDGIRFRLHGRTETFNYPSKAGRVDLTRAALAGAGNRDVAVLFDPHPHTSWFKSESDHDVWQLAIGHQTVHSLSYVQAQWRSDNTVARWLCFTFFSCGIVLACAAWRARLRRRARPAWT